MIVGIVDIEGKTLTGRGLNVREKEVGWWER